MKIISPLIAALILACRVQAGSTIDSAHPYAYGANVGWINIQGDTTHGAVISQYFCTGHLWSANCGWIGFGKGPTNGWHYSNTSPADWGVNHDGAGALSGYAYGANIGWISLSNAQAYTRTTRIDPGPDTDNDGIPDSWELKMTGNLTRLGGTNHDDDSDGAPDTAEYGADTNPTTNASLLKVSSFMHLPGTNRVEWTIEPTRIYLLEHTSQMTNGTSWTDSGYGPITPEQATTMSRDLSHTTQTAQFFRIKAFVPLSE